VSLDQNDLHGEGGMSMRPLMSAMALAAAVVASLVLALGRRSTA
jgi:hypothetical protein